MIRVIMHGCNGKMGHTISKLIAHDTTCTMVAGIDVNTDSTFDYPVFTSLDECTVDADVIIDFSIAHAVERLLDSAIKKSIPVVVCTTGLTKDQINFVHEASNKIPPIILPRI